MVDQTLSLQNCNANSMGIACLRVAMENFDISTSYQIQAYGKRQEPVWGAGKQKAFRTILSPHPTILSCWIVSFLNPTNLGSHNFTFSQYPFLDLTFHFPMHPPFIQKRQYSASHPHLRVLVSFPSCSFLSSVM